MSNVTFSNTDFVYLPSASDYPKDYQVGANFTPTHGGPSCIIVDKTGKIYFILCTTSTVITSSSNAGGIYGNIEWYVE